VVDGYEIRKLRRGDGAALARAYLRNAEHLAPWDPVRTASFYTVAHQEGVVDAVLADEEAGRGASWVLTDGAEVLGRANLTNVIRSVFQSCHLGYWVDGAHTGRGLATLMVTTACQEAASLGLHRVEAATMLANAASQAVLAKCGFEPVGTAPEYLFLAGRWQDHRVFQKLLHHDPPTR
jgi:ribosomal-protein-alanine N-acetyltransferase